MCVPLQRLISRVGADVSDNQLFDWRSPEVNLVLTRHLGFVHFFFRLRWENGVCLNSVWAERVFVFPGLPCVLKGLTHVRSKGWLIGPIFRAIRIYLLFEYRAMAQPVVDDGADPITINVSVDM